jgi:ABC-type multidrug transport system fused ATPase/permease subunit
MVLERDQKLPEKQIQSEPAFEEIEDPTNKHGGLSQVHDFQQNVVDIAPKKDIKPSTKKKIQMSF